MTTVSAVIRPTLDPAQEIRITALHRGFLYQHLYTVGCLLTAAQNGVTAVVVERDDDIELVKPDGRVYIQVKTRQEALIPSDINSATARFALLRREHATGRRSGNAHFVIVANQDPGPTLKRNIEDSAYGGDVDFVFPSMTASTFLSSLPPAWDTVSTAVEWCAAEANRIPHATLTSHSLVWKLAGLAQAAASGNLPPDEHAFQINELPALFEQILAQLQDFPAPLPNYRPQLDEPDFESQERVRIICGFSGSGKTSWAAQAATYIRATCVYFNATDTPSSALPSALVREVAPRFLDPHAEAIRRIYMPGATGIESLRLLDEHLGRSGLAPTIVIDNAHQLTVESIQGLLSVTSHFRFILLCQPSGSTPAFRGLLDAPFTMLSGWNRDTVASEASNAGAYGSPVAIERLRAQTGGMPLFVQSAVRLAATAHRGDIAAFCAALDDQTHLQETAQEIILSRTFSGLNQVQKNQIAILTMSDVTLTIEELSQQMASTFDSGARDVAATIRTLAANGIVEVFGGQRIRLHDAMRLLGQRHLEGLQADQVQSARLVLKDILYQSLVNKRDASRLSLFTRNLIALREVDIIIDLAGEELFHEMGFSDIVLATLELAVEDMNIEPEQRFWALDAIVFAKLQDIDLEKIEERLQAMENILREHSLSENAEISYYMKLMLFRAEQHDSRAVLSTISKVNVKLARSPYRPIFEYNAAVSLMKLGENRTASHLVQKVIFSNLESLGITEAWLLGKNLPDLTKLLQRTEDSYQYIKHLADAFHLRSILLAKMGGDPGLSRMYAVKLFSLVGAADSAIRVGQDAVDDWIARGEFAAARTMLEQQVLPMAEHYQMVGHMITIRSQYAVVLAYCGQFAAAEQEIARLDGYARGLGSDQQNEIKEQSVLIAEIKSRAPRLS